MLVLGYELSLLSLFLLATFGYLLLSSLKRLLFAQKTDPPLISAWIAVWGFASGRWKSPVKALLEGYDRLGPVFTLSLFGFKRITFVTGPEATAPFFKASDEILNQPEVYSFTKYVFGREVLYDLTPLEATHNIKNLSAALSATRMRTYADIMHREAKEFFDKFGDHGAFDLKDAMAKLIINTASRCLLGKEIRELLHERVAELYHDFDAGLTPIAFFAPWLPIKAHRKRDQSREEMQELFRPFIRDRREGKTVGEDFLQTLIEAKDKHGNPYTDYQITGMLLLSIFAGQHTSSVTATWTGILSFLHDKKLMRELYEEQLRVFGKYDGVFNWDSLGELRLLGQTIKEALRMYPPLLVLMRKVMKDIKICDKIVPAGDIIVVSPPVCNRCPDVYYEPSVFDPHRFDPDLEAEYPPFSYTAFGGGRHGCMGENFAYLQVKCLWSYMLQNFEFHLDMNAPPELDFSALVIIPEGKIPMRYTRRKKPFLQSTVDELMKNIGGGLENSDTAIRRPPIHSLKAKPTATSSSSSSSSKTATKTDAPKKFTKAEVAKHNTKDSCWLIIQNRVYDVTAYIPQHKGGDVILNNAGDDATAGFFGDQHPTAAREILEEYYIGDLA